MHILTFDQNGAVHMFVLLLVNLLVLCHWMFEYGTVSATFQMHQHDPLPSGLSCNEQKCHHCHGNTCQVTNIAARSLIDRASGAVQTIKRDCVSEAVPIHHIHHGAKECPLDLPACHMCSVHAFALGRHGKSCSELGLLKVVCKARCDSSYSHPHVRSEYGSALGVWYSLT